MSKASVQIPLYAFDADTLSETRGWTREKGAVSRDATYTAFECCRQNLLRHCPAPLGRV